MMGNMTPGTGMNMTTDMAPNCEKNQLGLGNHIMWGVGVSAQVSVDQGFFVTTELIGSFNVGTEQPTQSPLFWTIGVRRAKANATYFSAAYGIGLNDASPSHTVLVALGLVWETVPPPKKKDPPTVKVDINVTGLPSGATVSVAGNKDKSDAVVSGPPGGPTPKPGASKGDKGGSDSAKPMPPKYSTTADVDLPEGLVPEEASKGDKGGDKGGKGGGKGGKE
jgi:hypothetical protein